MRTIKLLRGAILLVGILLSACAPSAGPAAPANTSGGNSVSDVMFTGVIESMSGDQWVVNGQTIKVDKSVLQNGPFVVGDTIKVEAAVAADGSVTAQRVEAPSAADLVEMSTSMPDPSSTSVPDSSAQQPLVFDDSGTEALGTVESITDTSITIDGQTFTFAPGIEINGDITAGALVKLHFTVNADGTLSVTEIEFADPTQAGNDNSNDDNSSDSNVNDDNSNDDNSNDSNSNDDNGYDDNSNDDHGNDDNSNDDDGKDDNSGGGNDNG